MVTETKLTAAAVYRNSCVVKRSGRVPLTAGTQKVCLGGLSASVDESSLRMSLPEGLSGSNVQVEYPTNEQQEDTLREQTEQLADLKSQIIRLEKMAVLWEANADFSRKESLAVEEMTAYLEKLPDRLAKISAELAAVKEKKAALEKELSKSKKKAALPYVTAELTAEREGEYPVELSYLDHRAYWNPAYEIHAETENDALMLRLRAVISQHTDEDWENVKLTLYTGNPSASGSIPKLRPLHICFYVPRPAARRLAAFGGMMKSAMSVEETINEDSLVLAEAAAPAMAMQEVANGSGEAVKGETMTEYELSGVWNIRSEQEILCDIRTDRLPCRYHAAAVPRLSDEVYLAAEVAAADLEDLKGTEAAVYLKGAFAGNVFLDPDMTKDTYDLSLGVDETVRVKRQQKKRYSSNVLLKGQKKTEYEYEITLTSRKDKDISVTVTDQIPVSDEKSIIVEPLELSGAEHEEATGLLRWNFPLAPAETKTLTLSYTVAWPKDKTTQEEIR